MSTNRPLNYQALAWAIALCLVVAFTEILLGTEGLAWYGDIDKPSWHLPIAGWAVVAFIVYLLNGFIAYRLLSVQLRFGDRVIGLTALGIVMLFNAFWTHAFFTTESPLIGLLGLIAYLAPLSILQTSLWFFDRKSALFLFPYVGWVVLYDIPLYYVIWRLNVA